MARAAFGAKEARIREPREQVNLCGACGSQISASELLCKECRGTMGRPAEETELPVAFESVVGVLGH